MRILLVGDYSNVHATLARGLRELGHEVCLVSDGDGWKNYPRDIDVKREIGKGRWYDLKYLLRLRKIWKKLRGYDVVQLINPVFLPLKAERMWSFYEQLRRHNKKVVLCAFGMDHYWVKAGLDCRTFRYSDFNIGARQRLDEGENPQFIADWLKGAKGELNRKMAEDCDAIVAGLYEYYASYVKEWGSKLTFIPFPVVPQERKDFPPQDKIKFFIGIQKKRSAYKGTDVMWQALRRVAAEFPEVVEIRKAESVPFEEYCRLMDDSDVILDQLYSYTPGMNALEAMARGLVVVGGGEPENYEILNENEIRPIVNVEPTEESVYQALKDLVKHSDKVSRLQSESQMYIEKHHDYRKVAQRFLDLYEN